MKKLLLSIVVGSLLLTASCKKDDGKPGAVYLSINTPTLYCYSFNGYSFTGLSSGSSFDTYYNVSPGTYTYNYNLTSSCGYANYYSISGTYTLSAAEGEKGTYTSKGSDGATRYYNLSCEYYGATASY